MVAPPSIGPFRKVVRLENIKESSVPLFSQFWLWNKSIDLGSIVYIIIIIMR